MKISGTVVEVYVFGPDRTIYYSLYTTSKGVIGSNIGQLESSSWYKDPPSTDIHVLIKVDSVVIWVGRLGWGLTVETFDSLSNNKVR